MKNKVGNNFCVMSNTSPITLWLDHLLGLLPPKAIRLVGAGKGHSAWSQWIAAHGHISTTMVEADPAQFAILQQQQAAGRWTNATLLNTVIAPKAGDVEFFTASLVAESGLLQPEALRTVWRNVHTVSTDVHAAMDLPSLLQYEQDQFVDQQWLLLDCLPAAALLRCAQVQLQLVDVVVARVLLAQDNALSITDAGVSLQELVDTLPGFRLLALQASRHPALGYALFVRDYRGVAQQTQADLQMLLTRTQTEKSELLKKEELQTRFLQEIQADLEKTSEARDAEARGRMLAEQSVAQLQAQLSSLQAENAELLQKEDLLVQSNQALQAELKIIIAARDADVGSHQLSEKLKQEIGLDFKNKIEQIESIIKNLATKNDLKKSTKQIQAFIGLENYWETGNFPTANMEKHDWPVSPDFSLYIVGLMEKNDYNLIVEFGSGISTLVIAKAIKQKTKKIPNIKSIEFKSFDHLKKYYQQTLDALKFAGLSDYVQLHHAPLQEWISLSGEKYSFYSCKKIINSLAENYKNKSLKVLLIVDGPPGNTCHYARYPALPLILDVFPEADIDILLDDYFRSDEKGISKRWMEYLLEKGRDNNLIEIDLEKGACLIKSNQIKY